MRSASRSATRIVSAGATSPRCMADWTADRPRARRATLSAATVQTELSHLRTFAGWIGKPGLVRPAESYVSAPASVTRRYAATTDRSWSARTADPDALIEAIAREDAWVGAELRLARAFGLRVKEAVMLQPRLAELIRDRRARDRGHARRVARGRARHQGRTAAPRPHRFARQARGARRRESPRRRRRATARRPGANAQAEPRPPPQRAEEVRRDPARTRRHRARAPARLCGRALRGARRSACAGAGRASAHCRGGPPRAPPGGRRAGPRSPANNECACISPRSSGTPARKSHPPI